MLCAEKNGTAVVTRHRPEVCTTDHRPYQPEESSHQRDYTRTKRLVLETGVKHLLVQELGVIYLADDKCWLAKHLSLI